MGKGSLGTRFLISKGVEPGNGVTGRFGGPERYVKAITLNGTIRVEVAMISKFYSIGVMDVKQDRKSWGPSLITTTTVTYNMHEVLHHEFDDSNSELVKPVSYTHLTLPTKRIV